LPSTSEIVTNVRNSIGDYKTRRINIIDEPLGLATGTSPEVFYTKHMPVVTGGDTYLRSDRWFYQSAANNAAASGLRAYVFSASGGSFTIPAVATATTSGHKVNASYTYTKEQGYEYQDSELYEYVGDAVDWIQQYRSFSLTVTGAGTSLIVSPNPGRIESFLIETTSRYLIHKEAQDKGFKDGIFLKELDITIDTTKNSRNRQFAIRDLKDMVMDVINKMNLDDTAGAAQLVDTYSTYVSTTKVGNSYEINELDGQFDLGEGNV